MLAGFVFFVKKEYKWTIMNIFKIQNFDQETQDKMGNRAVIVFIIGVICLGGSLIVRNFITNRIDDSQKAFNRINSDLPKFLVKTSQVQQLAKNAKGEEFYEVLEKTAVQNPQINITTESKVKTLGKQKFVAFDANIDVTESFTLPQDITKTYIKMPLFVEGDVKDFSAKFILDDVVPLETFFHDNEGQGYYEALIPTYLAGKTVTLKYTWAAPGSRTINFSEGVYTATITSDWQTVRINGSDYGSIKKLDGNSVASFDFDKSYSVDEDNDFDRSDSVKNASIEFMAGTDDITLTDRVTKYAALVILLTFFLIFILDMRRKFTANALQYVMVGASLCLFYLLNLSLGEYTGFTASYIIATLVTILINGWYVTSVFNSKKYGFVTGVGLAIVYSVIYWLMRTETVNLLAGTIILYVVLMVLMVNTAKINRVNN